MEKYPIFATSSTEKRVATIIEYGEVVSEVCLDFMSFSPSYNLQMSPLAKAAFGLARLTLDVRDLLTVVSPVRVRLTCIRPPALKELR
jgi:hypothetical protein